MPEIERGALRHWLYLLLLLTAGGLLIAALWLPGCTREIPPAKLEVLHRRAASPSPASPHFSSLRVLTLNMAHARNQGFSQLLQEEQDILDNLREIARLLRQSRADAVALQEADINSFWNGAFDHVAYLSARADYGYALRGAHVNGWRLAYGTALLSRLPLDNGLSVTFNPGSLPSPRKGFIRATLEWPGLGEKRQIDLVSAHLDFLSRDTRRQQVEELIAHLRPRSRPLIVMGDFNCAWNDADASLARLGRTLGLKAYHDPDRNLSTFPLTGQRLDWILISEELEFKDYRVLEQQVSDHLAVFAEIIWNADE